jgi:ABC-2 type transport system ATP-binding protein
MGSEPIAVEGLTRLYTASDGSILTALRDVSIRCCRGEVHGLLGPNGAGKTTLVKILSTALQPTAGTVLVLGKDVTTSAAAIRPRISMVLGGETGLFGNLTAHENLLYWAALYGISGRQAQKRADAILDRVSLTDRSKDRVATFSRGMKQRVHLARGLISEPEVLFLDEPSAGMDPISALEFRQIIIGLKAENKTILLSTHDMNEATALCDRVSFINRGVVQATTSPADLRGIILENTFINFTWPIDLGPAPPSIQLPTRQAGIMQEGANRFRIEVTDEEHIPEILNALTALGVRRLGVGEPSLEDAYLRIMRRPAQ